MTVTPEKLALVEALQRVEEEQRARRAAEAEARRPQPSRRPAILAALALVSVAAAIWLLVAKPEWFLAPPPPPETVEVRDASMRMALYATAQRLEDHRRATGALPDSLGEIMTPVPGIGYARSGDHWVLTGRDGVGDDAVRLTLRSADSLEAFVGSSYGVLARRSQR